MNRWRRTRCAAAVALALLVPGACGEDGPEANPNAQPSDVVQTLDIAISTTAEPPTYDLRRGKLTYINVSSPEAGDVFLTGYNVTAKVEAGKSNSVIFDANQEGTFELLLRGKKSERTFAKLRITK